MSCRTESSNTLRLASCQAQPKRFVTMMRPSHRWRARFALIGLACFAFAPSFAQAPKAQQFALPDHGQLELLVPESWHAELHQPAGPLPPTITLTPSSGAPFQVLITAVWPLRAGASLPNLAAIHDQVAAAARALGPDSVEKVLIVREIGGAGNQGYYFAATDPAPKPGEFKYLAQGIVHLGEVNLAFTILTNDGQEAVVKAALDLVRRASHARTSAV